MIEKNEVLQMLEDIERQLFELEKEMEYQIQKERHKSAQYIKQDHFTLERKIASLEEKVNNNVPYRMLQSFA